MSSSTWAFQFLFIFNNFCQQKRQFVKFQFILTIVLIYLALKQYNLKYFNQFKKINMQKIETPFQYDKKWQTVTFLQTSKRIILFDDVQKFQKTKTYTQYLEFLAKLQKSIAGKRISETKFIQKFSPYERYFKKLQELLIQFPPIQQPMRYGNRAFKDWSLAACSYTQKFLEQLIPSTLSKAIPELYRYISESFGSNVRIDYGTGHQMSFMFFCWALYKLGNINEDELEQLVRQIFYQYVATMRKVQLAYMLEPAGSHGVWGLDDYVFLPFLLGAAQLLGNDEFSSPQCIHKTAVIQNNADEYMYFNCIKFILEVKKSASFTQSSPILNNISGAANWQKITGGMIKMYKAEVLGKHPVIKHQYFGTIIPFE